MKTMTGWTVRGRLIAGFGSVLVAVIALATIAIYQVESVRMRLDDIIDVNGVKERYAINFRGSVHDRSIAVRDVTLVPADELPKVIDHINSLEADYARSAQPFSQIFENATDVTPEERQIYGRITAARERTMPLISRIIELQKSGDIDGARKLLLADARPAFVDWLAAINTMIDYEESLSQDEGGRAREISKQFRLLMATLTALACLFSAGVAWLVVRNITRSLGADPRDMIAFAESIEAGDLSRRAPVRAGDTSSVMATVTRMRDNLADIVQRGIRHDGAGFQLGHVEQIGDEAVEPLGFVDHGREQVALLDVREIAGEIAHGRSGAEHGSKRRLEVMRDRGEQRRA